MDIPLNVDVYGPNGPIGHSTHIVLNPITEEVTHVVIRENFNNHTERLVPVEEIQETDTDMIRLTCDDAGLSQMETFERIEFIDKAIKVLWEGDEKGLLVGLLDNQNHFLGIGILDQVDYKRKILKIYTPVKMKISSLIFGHVKLNRNFQEIGLSTIYSKNL